MYLNDFFYKDLGLGRPQAYSGFRQPHRHRLFLVIMACYHRVLESSQLVVENVCDNVTTIFKPALSIDENGGKRNATGGGGYIFLESYVA